MTVLELVKVFVKVIVQSAKTIPQNKMNRASFMTPTGLASGASPS